MDYQEARVCLDQYKAELGEQQTQFLKGLWEIQERCTPLVDWEPQDKEELLKLARKSKPWLSVNTPQMPYDWFCSTLSAIREHIRRFAKDKDSSVFTADLSLIKESDLKDGVYQSDKLIKQLSKRLKLTHRSDENGMFALAVVSTVSCFARACAAKIYCPELLDYEFPESPACPVCGSAAALAVVRPTVSLDGGHRNLYCAHCDTSWHYPRIKCSHCGSVDPEDLRYFYRPSDPAHQMHVCRDCETAMPSIMLKDHKGQFNPMVEEAVFLPLAYSIMNSQLVQDYLDHKSDWGTSPEESLEESPEESSN